jgi:hypothetical protein
MTHDLYVSAYDRHFLLEAKMPPLNPPIPKRKPKSYQLPVLLTAYIVTSSMKIERMKVRGARKPCKQPQRNPFREVVSTQASMTSGEAQENKMMANNIRVVEVEMRLVFIGYSFHNQQQ